MPEETKPTDAATAVVKNTSNSKPSTPKQSSSRAAFQGAPFDKNGFCINHPKVQLGQPIKNEQGKLMYQELKRTCPNCQQEKHRSKKGTSLGGGKVREGRVHGYKQSTGEKTEERRARSVSRGRKPVDKPRKEYDTPFDEKGRCHYHKNIQLATKKMGGGWKVVHSICPKCMEDRYDDDRSVKSGSSRKSSKSLSSKLEGRSADGQYDKNGCCILHTHIQVAKKRVFGSGWKVVRTCPSCEKGEAVGLDDDRMSVCSKSSRKSSRSVGSRSVKSSRSVRSTAEKGKAATSSRYGVLPFDADGYCCRHPSVQLAQKKMMGGFKIIHDTCPDCAAEGGRCEGKRRVPRRKSSGTGRVFDDSGSECSGSVSSSKKQKRRRVKNLKTEDENGKHGRYSGDVDENYRPNGQGLMKYEDGTVWEGVWSEGSQVHGKTKKR